MRFNRINSENMRLDDNTKVSSTYTRQMTADEFCGSGVLKNPRLGPFIGNYPERKEVENIDYLMPVEEHAKALSDYAKQVQEAVNPNKGNKKDQ